MDDVPNNSLNVSTFTQRHFQVKMNEKKSYLNINIQKTNLEWEKVFARSVT